MTWIKNLNVCLSAVALACSASAVQATGWTFVDMRTFTENATGLMWDQCSSHNLSEECGSGSISGAYTKFSPDAALAWATKSNADGHYGYSDWCVPNFSTLKNLYASTQNTFPGYPGAFWLMTSTPAPVGAYQVITGNTAYGNASESVRLVRSTVYFGPNAACDVRVSASIPTISPDGTLTNNLVVNLTNGGRGTGYWVAVTDRMRAPTAAEVKAGVMYDTSQGGGVVAGSAPVAGGSSGTNISVARFYSTYPLNFPEDHVYFVLEDSQGNLSSVVGPMANSSLLSQSINFDNPSDTRVGTDVVLRATSSSGKTVEFASATPAVCSVNGGVATALQSGVCSVYAKLPNDGTYSAAPTVSRSFTFLPKSDQSIGFVAAFALQVGGSAATLSATGGASGNPVSFSTSSAACSLSGSNNSIVSGVAAGNCTVQADQAGNADYNAASAVTQTITVGKGDQGIGFSAPPLQVGATANLGATGGASGNPVIFSTSSAACSLSGSNNTIVSGVAAGACTVRANQAGDTNYNAATTATQTITVGKGGQAISFGAVPVLQVGGASATLSATGGVTGNPVTFSTSSPACGLSGSNNSVVSSLAAGACVVRADQAGNANYNAASTATQTITVGKGGQAISFGAVPVLQVGGASATLSATGGITGNPVTFSTSSPACSLSGSNNSVVSSLAAGTCVVQADQAGNANYNAASTATQTITVGKGGQAISFGPAPVLQFGGASATLSATGGASGNPVTFSTSSPACSLSGSNNSIVKGVAAGNCTVQADQAGSANYTAAAQVTQSFTVSQVAQTITFGTAPTVTVGGGGTVTTKGGASGNARVYASTNAAACTVDSSTGVVSGVAAGTNNCTITADQMGNANYLAAPQVSLTLSIGAAPVPTPVVPLLSRASDCGLEAWPDVVNLGQGDGPAFTADLVALLAKALGQPLVFVGQSACGIVTLSGYNAGQLAFVPHTYKGSGDTRANGIYALGDGSYQGVSNGQSLVIAPAPARVDQLTALLPSMSVTLVDNGVLTASLGGALYVVQPGVAVQLDPATGSAQLRMGADGYWHFIDAMGNNQILYPAFADPSALKSALLSLDPGVTFAIALDGTASIGFFGQHYTLVPDLTLATVPAERIGLTWWQDSATHFWLLNTLPLGTAQGFTARP